MRLTEGEANVNRAAIRAWWRDWSLLLAWVIRSVAVVIASLCTFFVGALAAHRIRSGGNSDVLSVLGAKAVLAVFTACALALGATLSTVFRRSPKNLIRLWLFLLSFSLVLPVPRTVPSWVGWTIEIVGILVWICLIMWMRRWWGRDWWPEQEERTKEPIRA